MKTQDVGKEWTLTSDSPEQTQRIGQRIGERLTAGSCVALTGQLGAGKTELVKGIAAGAGVTADVTVNSPTFVIINEYPGRLHLLHIDAYRLGGVEEIEAIGIEEMLAGPGAVLIEWADRVPEVLPEHCLHVAIEHTGGNARRLSLAGPSIFAGT